MTETCTCLKLKASKSAVEESAEIAWHCALVSAAFLNFLPATIGCVWPRV